MPRKRQLPRWLHFCHVNGREYVVQGNRCRDCGRTRTPQAEQAYRDFAKENGVKM